MDGGELGAHPQLPQWIGSGGDHVPGFRRAYRRAISNGLDNPDQARIFLSGHGAFPPLVA